MEHFPRAYFQCKSSLGRVSQGNGFSKSLRVIPQGKSHWSSYCRFTRDVLHWKLALESSQWSFFFKKNLIKSPREKDPNWAYRISTRFLAPSAQTGDLMTKAHGFKHFDFCRSWKVIGVKFGEFPRNKIYVCEIMSWEVSLGSFPRSFFGSFPGKFPWEISLGS